MNNKLSNWVLSLLLWTWGGTFYFFCEVVYKTLTHHPERISWTMLVLALILCIPLERCGAELVWEMPIWLQSICCTLVITATEFVAGLILNVWLGLGVWDYSDLPFNLMGQICLEFSAIWLVLSVFGIIIFDWMRYVVQGGEKPHYHIGINKYCQVCKTRFNKMKGVN